MKAEFAVPSDVPYYSEVGRYNEVKYQVEPSEFRMEFYLEIMKLFFVVSLRKTRLKATIVKSRVTYTKP